MPSIELSKLPGVSGPRALSTSDRAQLDSPVVATPEAGPANVARSGVANEVTAPLDTLEPPIDADRVAQIRKALEDGTYPLVPTKIADAMIAARVGFGLGE
jgi:negative regulator of flagellin synthesis FlgM